MQENNTITIFCKNNHQYYNIKRGTPLLEVYKQIGIELPFPVIVARVNYKIQSLDYIVFNPKDIEFIDASKPYGMMCYVRTLSLVLAYAIHELYPRADLRIEHPISKGYYCKLTWKKAEQQGHLTPEMISAIKQKMQEVIAADYPIIVEEKQTKEVIKLFSERDDSETSIIETIGNPYCRYFRLNNYIDYYNGVLLPSTGHLNLFDLIPFHEGMFLRIPCRSNPTVLEEMVPQEKMFEIFKEYVQWNKLLHISNVGEFNKACKNNKSFELIKLSEALHEKKVAQIADMIANGRKEVPKFILISGPSSSGKTTFSKRLTVQLLVNGIRPITISLDNYFVNRDQTPRDEFGKYDFETVHAVDIQLFKQQLKELTEGKEIDVPTYNFELGKREYRGNKLKLQPEMVVIMEGLHMLNPILLPDIPREQVFKIYVSALTTINLDNHNWIPTADVRLLRRIVRDYRYRGYSAKEIISICESVKRGEEKWIFPFQEEADVMFNSALLFELAVLRRHAEPILAEVPKYCEEYTEAHRLLRFLNFFVSIPENEIPPTSFLREFVGGSSFRY